MKITSVQFLVWQSVFSAFLASFGFHVLVIFGTSATTSFGDAFVFSFLLSSFATIGFLLLNFIGISFSFVIPSSLRGSLVVWNTFLVFGLLSLLFAIVSLRPFWLGFLSHNLAIVFSLVCSAFLVRNLLRFPQLLDWFSGRRHLFASSIIS